MLKLITILTLAISLTACASHRQPRAKCSGPLERINVLSPESLPPQTESRADESAGSDIP
jgi:hypothetical protein